MGNAPPISPGSGVNRGNAGHISFATFEVDLRAGELRKSGVKIKLHGQPFAVLAMLLQRAGEVVTREELQQELWASDTFVDFEHGLNKAINKVREALGDDADNPRYIETLPRRGYRFVGPVVQPGPVPAPVAIEQREADKRALPRKTSRPKWWAARLGVVGVCVLAIVGLNRIRYWTRPPRVLSYRQLTTNRQLKGIAPCGGGSSLVTDGARVFFSEPSSSVAQVSASGGEVVEVSVPFPCFLFWDLSPDKTELLGISQTSNALDQPLWSLSIASGQARRLGNLSGHAAAWSPDGQRIAYASGNDSGGPSDLYIALKDGSDTRRLTRFEKGSIYSIGWSPDGSVLRILVFERSKLSHLSSSSVWEISAEGTNLHRMTLFPGEAREIYGITWTPDGRYSLLTVRRLSSYETDIWVRRESKQRFLSSAARPVQLTSGPMSFSKPTPSSDGKRVFVIGGQSRGELVRYDMKAGRLEPFLSGISADHLDFSRDGKWVTYVTFPEGILWRSRVDGSERLQLTAPPLRAGEPQWSPDGTRVAFAAQLLDGYFKIYVVSAEGGKPEIVAEDQNNDVVDPTWTPDGNSLIFGKAQWSPQGISSLDLQTGRISMIPGPTRVYGPRISPDGRFIVALNMPGNSKLLLFDRQTQKWSDLLEGRTSGAHWPRWSSDSKYVYFALPPQGIPVLSLYRVRVTDHKLEHMAAVEVPEGMTGLWGPSFGIAPDRSPLLLRDSSIQEIYALDVELP